MSKFRERFEKEMEQIHRENTRKELRQQQMLQVLPIPPPMPERLTPSPSSVASSIRFPVESGRPTRNFCFFGRDETLAELHSVLQLASDDTREGPACSVIHGMAGLGKTQTALEYSYVHGNSYQAIFWLRAQTHVQLSRDFSLIAMKLRLQPILTPQGSQSSKSSGIDELGNGVELAREWLEKTGELADFELNIRSTDIT
jgi:hypothetical protein